MSLTATGMFLGLALVYLFFRWANKSVKENLKSQDPDEKKDHFGSIYIGVQFDLTDLKVEDLLSQNKN
jgi:hypothetical protein